MKMFERIKERTDLAVTYAKDGAYFIAADILEQITKETRQHCRRLRAEEKRSGRLTAPGKEIPS